MHHYEQLQSPAKIKRTDRTNPGMCCCLFRERKKGLAEEEIIKQSESQQKKRDILRIQQSSRVWERQGVVICHEQNFSQINKKFVHNLVLTYGPHSEFQHYKCIRLGACASVILPSSSDAELLASSSCKLALLIPRSRKKAVLEQVRRRLQESFEGRTVQQKWQWLNWRLTWIDQQNLLLERAVLSLKQVAANIYSTLSSMSPLKLSSRLVARISRLRLQTLQSLGQKEAESLGELLQTEEGSQGLSQSNSQWQQLIFPQTPTRKRIGSQEYKISFVQV